jgi:hypothetical protein
MDMDQAAIFLAGSILTIMGFIVIVIGIVVINNIIHKYWKPVQIFKYLEFPPRFENQQETRVTPTLEKDTTGGGSSKLDLSKNR